MAISVSPRPGDGALNPSSSSVQLVVTTTSSTTLSAVVRTPSGARIPLENMVLVAGQSHLTLSLPPGGVPPGSKLILMMVESSGPRTVVKYRFA